MDQRTRKLMTMEKVLHPRDDIDSLYMTRKEERGLARIEDCVDGAVQGLQESINKSKREDYKCQLRQ